jgi:pimeloyl-ACP methyl ester carboxylesterase
VPIAHTPEVDLAYEVRGSGPTVLLIMGLGGRGADWNAGFVSRLAGHFEVVCFDNRGVGASGRPDGEYLLETLADDSVAVLDAIGRRRAHVIGVSMGGMIAQLVALRHPTRVERLVLLATSGGGASVTPPTPAAAAVLVPDRSRPIAEMVRTSMTAISAPDFAERDPAAVESIVALAVAQPTPALTFARQISAILTSDRSADLGRVTAPTLVVHGTEDPLIPLPNGHFLARAIPGARLVELPGCGHLPMWECPEELAHVLLGFLVDDAG